MAHQPLIHTQLHAVLDRVTSDLNQLVALLSTEIRHDHTAPTIVAVEAAGRLMDAARVRALAPLVGNGAAAERLGYASPVAAVASLAQVLERTARSRLRVASAVCPDLTITGAPLPAVRAVLSETLDLGKIGLDAAALIATELDTVAGRVDPDVLDAAEAIMINLATGSAAGDQPVVATVSVDYLSTELRQLTATIDPDGARPREERAVRRRGFRLGAPDADGLVPASGRLLPEIGGMLAGMLEAHRRSPRFRDVTALDQPHAVAPDNVDELAHDFDPRTPDQRRHDAFAEIVLAAATADGAPALDGQAVTVLVTVTSDDLNDPNGLASDPIGVMAGSPAPVSRRQVERFIDVGGYRTVTLTTGGAVTGISTPQRCFTPLLRMGIAARDGTRCLTPGCTNPHTTLQAHHVIPDRDGGPTATDNGILLCFWHHMMVDRGPWEYKMIHAVPHVRGPGILAWTRARPHLQRAA